MRIAIVHSYYSSATPSGENIVVDAQAAALREAGHDVTIVSQHTDARARRRSYAVEAAATVATGIGPSPEAELRRIKPDVVHIHNLFPNFGTRWLDRWQGPIVATLHNFRPMCAAGTLFRDGNVCTRCPDGSPWAALQHGCYRGSRVATAPLAWRNRHGLARDAVVRRADRLIVLSERARDVYERAGAQPERLRLIPNFVEAAPQRPAGTPTNRQWLYAGRLSAEKGILDLLRIWPEHEELHVAGDGPLRDQAIAAAPPGVRFLGRLTQQTVRSMMAFYQGLIFPSRWFEGLPTVYLEALSAGLPVVALEGCVPADDVAEHRLGAVLPRQASQAALRQALDNVRTQGDALRDRCRDTYTARFTQHQWIAAVENLYREVIGRHGSVTTPFAERVRVGGRS